jgi:L-fuculose-phosphate aldolase
MIEEFRRIGSLMFQERLVGSHGGDLSVRQGEKILITRRDAMLGDLKETDLVEVGMAPGENDPLASRELESHRALYRQTAAQAIVYAHPVKAIAISLTDNKVVPQDAEGLYLFKSAAIVRVHGGIGSGETARMLPSFFGENVVVAVKGHGTFAIGKTLAEAYRLTSALELSCAILVAMRSSSAAAPRKPERTEYKPAFKPKSAIPPGIGVMDRSRYYKKR